MGPIDITSIPFDPYIILLVLLAGIFQKKFLGDVLPAMGGKWKTLLVSLVFCALYGAAVYHAGSFTKELPKAYLLSFIAATTLYNYFFKKYVAKWFGEDVTKVLVLMLVMPAMLSCRSIKKSSRESFSQEIQQKSLHSEKVDSSVTNTAALFDTSAVQLQKKTVIRKNGLSLTFSEGAAQSTPVTVHQQNGTTVVDPGGRNLLSLDLDSTEENHTVDSSAYRKAIEEFTGQTNYLRASLDSAVLQIRSSAQVSFETSVKKVVVGGIIAYIILIGAAILYLKKRFA